MAKIKNLYDAIIKTQSEEDQCTNFLVWLLGKLPSKIILEICKIAGLSISQVEIKVNIEVQYKLKKDSRPDALIEFSEGKYLIIETKRYPNNFDKEQFLKYFNGGKDEFGEQNIWLMFLSCDEDIPGELDELKKKHYGRIGFISWKSLLQFIGDNVDSLGKEFEIITKEFIYFAENHKLRSLSMNNEEINRFIEAYPVVVKYQESVLERFSRILENIKDRIVTECEELVEKNEDDEVEKLPCLYGALNIDGWHIKGSSGYVFIDIFQKKVGIVLTGYQDKNEKEKFQPQWSENYKNKYKDDANLCSFTWINKGEDEYAIKGGYFKVVEETSGKIFNPTQISELKDCFYWGYVYDLDIEKIQIYNETIPKDFKKLLKTFLQNE